MGAEDLRRVFGKSTEIRRFPQVEKRLFRAGQSGASASTLRMEGADQCMSNLQVSKRSLALDLRIQPWVLPPSLVRDFTVRRNPSVPLADEAEKERPTIVDASKALPDN